MQRRFKSSISVSACVLLTLVWLAAGCGGGAEEGGTPNPAAPTGGGGGGGGGGQKSDATPAETEGGEAAAPTNAEGWGTLTGRITLKGDIPQLEPLVKQGDKQVKDAATCAMHNVPNERLVVDPETKGIRDVFVYLRRKPDRVNPDLAEPAQKDIDFDQHECRFLHHALAMQLDQTLMLKNSDPISHNTNIQGGPAGTINPLLPPNAKPDPFNFSRSRPVPVPVSCNIHPWMKSWILPQDQPYFAVTDEKGQFTIDKLPAGEELEFRLWQEVAGYVNSADGSITKGILKVTVPADGTATKDVEIDVSTLDLK